MRRPRKAAKYNWLKAKKDFLTDSQMSLRALAKKHKIPLPSVEVKSRREGWLQLREEIMFAAEQRMLQEAEKEVAEVKQRHVKIGRLLQKRGVEAIEAGKKPKSAREALQFTAEGVKIEREAMGIDRKQPQIVNIIGQQQAVIDQYRKNEQGTEQGELNS